MIGKLPLELQFTVIGYLSAPDAVHLGRVCHELRERTEDNAPYWAAQIRQDFPRTPAYLLEGLATPAGYGIARAHHYRPRPTLIRGPGSCMI